MSSELDLRVLGARAILDVRGQSRLLGSLWRHQPAVLVWLRHFACLFCKEQASEARKDKGSIEARGARLAFIGSGSTAQASQFRERYVPDCAVFTDPSSYTYRTIGARESMASTMGGMVRHGPRAMRHGYFQTTVQRRPFQQGGVLVALPGDEVAYAYLSRLAGDHPPIAEVLAALRASTEGPVVVVRPQLGGATAAGSPGGPTATPAPVVSAPPPPPLPAWPRETGAARHTWSPAAGGGAAAS